MVRRWSFAGRGMLYFVFVPVFSVMLGGTHFWTELFQNSSLNWQMVSQMLEFQFMLPFNGWIGTTIVWLTLAMLALQVCMSFELLLVFNRFLDKKEWHEQNAGLSKTIDDKAADESEEETTDDD